MILNLNNFLKFLIEINQGKSLCRILQNIECGKIFIRGNVLEFGAEPGSKKNFSSIAKKKNVLKISFSDKYISKKGVIKADLNTKINLKKNHYETVILFNVLEHLFNFNNAKKEIVKILKKKGVLIGSTPFLYRFHGAPSDNFRFTKAFYEKFFKKEFEIVRIFNLGFGPFCSSYSLIADFTKKIPFLNLLLFSASYFLDLILSKLVKYDLEDIYPIGVFFIVKKK